MELTNAVAAVLWADPGVTVLQLAPSLRLAINVAGAAGQTLRARFFAGATQTVNVPPIADAHVQNGDQSSVNFGTSTTLALKASGSTQVRETFLLFTLPPLTAPDEAYGPLHYSPDGEHLLVGHPRGAVLVLRLGRSS